MFKKLTILIIIIAAICLVSIFWYFSTISSSVEITQPKIFTIQKGQGVNQISQNLFQEKLIKSKFAFETYLYLKKLENIIKAGDYQFTENINTRQLVQKLIQGTTMDEDTITIIEGWTNLQIADYLEQKNIAAKKVFIEKSNCGCGVKVAEFEFLHSKPNDASLEGFLFPDTYRVFKDATEVEIINKMLNNFDQKITPKMRQDIADQDKDVFEIVTMASIIEKEARALADKKQVSDIFWKRIEADMGLESCATINYITGKSDPAAAWADLEVESPYNTYKYKGLPPGPICNPGLDSIIAAIYPSKTDYWYFLNSTDGTTHFARNFEEHKNNKWKYLK